MPNPSPAVVTGASRGFGRAIAAALTTAGATVVVTADCGTSAIAPVRALQAEGIDVIISDHHLPGGDLPNAFAVLNPKRQGCGSEDKDRCAAGTAFEMDDRFTGYDAASIARMGFDGGKMLFRIDPDDPATVVTMEACARAVSDLASHALMAMVEPFISHRLDGRVRNDLSPEAVIRSITVAAGLGATSAYTWLKLPVVEDMERVMAATPPLAAV